MRVKSQRDFWSGVLFAITGVAFAIGATSYAPGTSARPGPGFFPLGLGVLVAGLGVLVLLKSIVSDTADGEPIGAIAWRPLIAIVAALIVFGFCLPRLGLLLTLPLLVVVASLAGDEFRWREVFVNAVVLTLGCWLLFVVLLKLTIPVWPTLI